MVRPLIAGAFLQESLPPPASSYLLGCRGHCQRHFHGYQGTELVLALSGCVSGTTLSVASGFALRVAGRLK